MAGPWEKYAAPQPVQETAPLRRLMVRGRSIRHRPRRPQRHSRKLLQLRRSHPVVGGIVSAMQGPTLGFYELTGLTGAASLRRSGT